MTLREHGDGETIFVFPGMEGSGESCLHLVAPVIERASSAGQRYRLVLVDYAEEEHARFEDLVTTMQVLVRDAARGEACIFWGQSFGNLLATGVPEQGGVAAQKFVLVSPFTALPPWRTHIGVISMYFTPTFLYRWTIGLVGKFTFGPVGDQGDHPFFDALRKGTPKGLRRRTGWLRSRTFEGRFNATPAPTKAWLGKRDRLVNLDEQRDFFGGLAESRSDYFLSMADGCGHVFLPSDDVRAVREQLLEWLTERSTGEPASQPQG